MLWGGNPTQILLRYGTYFFGTVASIHNAQEQMSEVRSFAYIIDTSMKKIANRSMNLDENISNILDM